MKKILFIITSKNIKRSSNKSRKDVPNLYRENLIEDPVNVGLYLVFGLEDSTLFVSSTQVDLCIQYNTSKSPGEKIFVEIKLILKCITNAEV